MEYVRKLLKILKKKKCIIDEDMSKKATKYGMDDIIAEISESKISERGARMDDKVSEAAMEDRKKGGYF